jgi:hypothetical protein
VSVPAWCRGHIEAVALKAGEDKSPNQGAVGAVGGEVGREGEEGV